MEVALQYLQNTELCPIRVLTMPKDLIKKYMPDAEKIKGNKHFAFLGDVLHEPNLWHLNRHSVTKAFAIGLFWGCIPMPLQMLAAAIVAVRLNANLPLSVAIVWFSNPVTMPPIFYFEYLVGAWLMDMPAMKFEYELSFEWIMSKLYEVGAPMYLGSLVCGIALSAIGYFLISFLWKRSVRKRWHQRVEARKQRDQ